MPLILIIFLELFLILSFYIYLVLFRDHIIFSVLMLSCLRSTLWRLFVILLVLHITRIKCFIYRLIFNFYPYLLFLFTILTLFNNPVLIRYRINHFMFFRSTTNDFFGYYIIIHVCNMHVYSIK